MINIVIWNTRGIREKRAEIVKRIKDYDIFAITESKIDNQYVFNVAGYTSVRWTALIIIVEEL